RSLVRSPAASLARPFMSSAVLPMGDLLWGDGPRLLPARGGGRNGALRGGAAAGGARLDADALAAQQQAEGGRTRCDDRADEPDHCALASPPRPRSVTGSLQ